MAQRATGKPAPTPGNTLKQAIHVARARAGIASDVQLSQVAGVSYDTLMNWYSGRTTPRPNEIRKVASVLSVPYGDLLAAYEGRDPEPVPLQAAIRELVMELRLSRQQTEAQSEQMIRVLETLLRERS